jgi:hypothetical protein
MAEIYPLGAVPLVGFAMWYLDRGVPEAEVLAAMEAHRDWGSLGPIIIHRALERAKSNLAATRLAELESFGVTFQEALGKPIDRNESVGMRVLMSALFRDGHEQTISVTVNARPGMIIDEALAAAEQFTLRGGLNRGRGPAYDVVSVVATLQQVIEGGLPSAALELK